MSTKTIPLPAAASLYGLSASEFHHLHGGHFNKVYGFQHEGRNYALRLTPPSEDTDLGRQRSILAWMAHLAAHGACVPQPLPSRNGNLVEVIPSPEGEWLAVALTQAEGILSEELSLDQLGAKEFQLLGTSVGRVHAIARSYAPPRDVSFPQWETGDNLFSHRICHEYWLQQKQFALLEQIRLLPRPVEAYGLIHCDLHFGNFFVDVPGRRITLIDFDDCTYGWFVMDIAVVLFDVLVLYTGTDKDRYGQDFLQSFLTGYLAEYPLPKFWLEQLPLFLKLLEINVYDTVARLYPESPGEWVVKFMTGRKDRLESDAPYVNLKY